MVASAKLQAWTAVAIIVGIALLSIWLGGCATSYKPMLAVQRSVAGQSCFLTWESPCTQFRVTQVTCASRVQTMVDGHRFPVPCSGGFYEVEAYANGMFSDKATLLDDER